MLKQILALCVFTTLIFNLQAQKTVDNNTTTRQMFCEVGGPGILFSISYDSRFKPNERSGLGFRAGLGFTLVDKETVRVTPNGNQYDYRTKSVYTLPLTLNYVLAKPNSPNMLEIGAGVTLLSSKASILNYNDYTEGRVLGHTSFMYRRQPVEGGFSWRVGITPIINNDGDIFPFGALGFGYSFK